MMLILVKGYLDSIFKIHVYEISNIRRNKKMKNLLVIFSVFCIGVWFGASVGHADSANSDFASEEPFVIPAWLKEYGTWADKTLLREGEPLFYVSKKITFLYMLDVMGRDTEVVGEAGVRDSEIFNTILQALDHPNFLLRLEGIYILRHWSAFPERFYHKLVEVALFDDTLLVRTEAFFALKSYAKSVALTFRTQKLLAQALTDPFVNYRKKAFRILSSQKELAPSVIEKLHEAVSKQHFLKEASTLNPEVISDLHTKFSQKKLLLFDQQAVIKLSTVNSDNTQLSRFLGDLLNMDLSDAQVAHVVKIVTVLRVLNADTIPPLLAVLSQPRAKSRQKILRILDKAPVSWYNKIFQHLKGMVLHFNMKDQSTGYYLMQKMLWQHPQVRKNIKTIINSYEPIHIELRNLLFNNQNRFRVAGLYLLSKLQSVSHNEIKRYLLDSLSSDVQFTRMMSLLVIDKLSVINKDVSVQKLLIKKVNDTTVDIFLRTSILSVLHEARVVDLSILQDILYLALFDTEETVRKNAIHALQHLSNVPQLVEFRDQVINTLVNRFKQPVVGIDFKLEGGGDLFETKGGGDGAYSKNPLSLVEWKAIVWVLGVMQVQDVQIWRMLARFLDTPVRDCQKVVYHALQRMGPTDPVIIEKLQHLRSFIKPEDSQFIQTESEDVTACQKAFH